MATSNSALKTSARHSVLTTTSMTDLSIILLPRDTDDLDTDARPLHSLPLLSLVMAASEPIRQRSGNAPDSNTSGGARLHPTDGIGGVPTSESDFCREAWSPLARIRWRKTTQNEPSRGKVVKERHWAQYWDLNPVRRTRHAYTSEATELLISW
jgi:hypothetical protein